MGLLEEVYQLPYRFETTDFVLSEVKDASLSILLDRLIATGRLQVVLLSPKQVADVSTLRQKHRKLLSPTDCSLLLVAELRQGILLTGDGNLRKLAIRQLVKVHGTLWLLDRLVEENVITSSQACSCLRKLLADGTRRLPKAAVSERLLRWCGPKALPVSKKIAREPKEEYKKKTPNT